MWPESLQTNSCGVFDISRNAIYAGPPPTHKVKESTLPTTLARQFAEDVISSVETQLETVRKSCLLSRNNNVLLQTQCLTEAAMASAKVQLDGLREMQQMKTKQKSLVCGAKKIAEEILASTIRSLGFMRIVKACTQESVALATSSIDSIVILNKDRHEAMGGAEVGNIEEGSQEIEKNKKRSLRDFAPPPLARTKRSSDCNSDQISLGASIKSSTFQIYYQQLLGTDLKLKSVNEESSDLAGALGDFRLSQSVSDNESEDSIRSARRSRMRLAVERALLLNRLKDLQMRFEKVPGGTNPAISRRLSPSGTLEETSVPQTQIRPQQPPSDRSRRAQKALSKHRGRRLIVVNAQTNSKSTQTAVLLPRGPLGAFPMTLDLKDGSRPSKVLN